jgi:hypothetical protein
MGLWLKCPGCNITNPLSLRVCPKCGRSLDNLSSAERVYVIGPAAEPAPTAKPALAAEPAPSAHPATRPEAAIPVAVVAAAPKPAKQPKKSRKKKS